MMKTSAQKSSNSEMVSPDVGMSDSSRETRDRSPELEMGATAESMTSSLHREREEEMDIATEMQSKSSSLPRSRLFSSNVKAKKLRFYRNGDRFFPGHMYVWRPDRVKQLCLVIDDLTKVMGISPELPNGVRVIFTSDGKTRITSVDQFVDGESYVCSSTEYFKQIDYANVRQPFWQRTFSGTQQGKEKTLDFSPFKSETNYFVVPRIVTVIRNGVRPRRAIQHLLNKRTARSFCQVLQDLSNKVRLQTGAIRKLYTARGQEITELSAFFKADDVFIAFGTEKTSADDFLVRYDEKPNVRYYGKKINGGLRKRTLPSRNESLQDKQLDSPMPDDPISKLPITLAAMMKVIKKIGDGISAFVYEVELKSNEERCALKIIPRENYLSKEGLIGEELQILSEIRHENIIMLREHWNIDDSIYMLTELAPAGDLFDYISIHRTLSEIQAARMIKNVASALDYLHRLSIVHRDIKPENLLLYPVADELFGLKITDFGLATRIPEDGEPLYTCCGTPTYVAPEILTNEGYGVPVDVWSLGIILYILLVGFPPFQSNPNDQVGLFRQIVQGHVGFPSPSFDTISWSAKALILSMVNIWCSERCTAAEVLDSAWLQANGAVDEEHEAYAKLFVEVRLREFQELEEDNTEADGEAPNEYYYSRRASMDELSECMDF